MRHFPNGFVVSVLAGILVFFALPSPQGAHSAIDRDPYGVEKADKIAPGWMEGRMQSYLGNLWFERGEHYSRGSTVKQNHEAAFEWYEKAAYLDHPKAQFRLAIAYHCGTGTKPDIHLAVKWFASAADLGYERAYHSLAHLYGDDTDHGLPQDVEKAHMLFRKAGESGNAGLGLESHLENPHNISCD